MYIWGLSQWLLFHDGSVLIPAPNTGLMKYIIPQGFMRRWCLWKSPLNSWSYHAGSREKLGFFFLFKICFPLSCCSLIFYFCFILGTWCVLQWDTFNNWWYVWQSRGKFLNVVDFSFFGNEFLNVIDSHRKLYFHVIVKILMQFFWYNS